MKPKFDVSEIVGDEIREREIAPRILNLALWCLFLGLFVLISYPIVINL